MTLVEASLVWVIQKDNCHASDYINGRDDQMDSADTFNSVTFV